MMSRKQMFQREIQSLFFAQENTVQGSNASIPCSQVLQLCACLMQHALNRRVHSRTRAHVQQLIEPASWFEYFKKQPTLYLLIFISGRKRSRIKPSQGEEQRCANTYKNM